MPLTAMASSCTKPEDLCRASCRLTPLELPRTALERSWGAFIHETSLLTSDPTRTHHKSVQVPFLGHGGAVVPVVLKEDRVESVR